MGVNKKLGIWPFWAKNPGKCVGRIQNENNTKLSSNEDKHNHKRLAFLSSGGL